PRGCPPGSALSVDLSVAKTQSPITIGMWCLATPTPRNHPFHPPSIIHHPSSTVLGHGITGNPAGGPGCLEIEAAGQSVDIEQFPREIKSGANPAFHSLEVYFV